MRKPPDQPVRQEWIEARKDQQLPRQIKEQDWSQRRKEQNIDWFRSLVRETVLQRFTRENLENIKQLELAVGQSKLSVPEALGRLLGE